MYIDKEEDRESGDYNFGVRQYDNRIGRFMAVDPLWEKFRAWSPYNYAENNPLRLKDPSGKGPDQDWHGDDDIAKPKLEEKKVKSSTEVESKQVTATKESTGRNFGGTNYTGPNNPVNAQGKSDYSLPPTDASDAIAKQHDIEYDNSQAVGAMGLFLDPRDGVYDADVRFVNAQTELIGNYIQGKQDQVTGQQLSFGTALRATIVSGVIGAAVLIKSLPNVVENVVTETKNQIQQQLPYQP